MKKMFQNMLLRDFIGATLCLMMTFVLLMMVSGCSEDSKSVGSLGGAGEETGVYALAGRMGDVQPRLLRVADEQDSLPEYENFVTVEKGTIVTVYELDSLTLDTTGRFFADTIDNDSGRFVFEEIGLNGPYILIVEENGPPIIADERGRMTFKYMTYSAIVNVQNLTNVSVNALTSAKVPFLREYVAHGKTFAEANKMAERDVLKQLGIYEDLGPFEELFGEKSELAYAEALLLQRRDLIAYDFLEYVERMLYIPKTLVADSGAEAEEYYLNNKKMVDYQVGLLAEDGGIGQCTESRENEMTVLSVGEYGDSITIVCHSGKWNLGLKKIEYTMGTMTDSRDGQTYKTVTYNVGGVSQTWMAQNLNFVDTVSSGIDSALKANLKGNTFTRYNDRSGKIYGRFYTWLSAMNIGEHDFRMYSIDSVGDTVFLEQQCFDAYLYDCAEDDYECMNEQDRVRNYCDSIYILSCVPKDAEAEKICVNTEMEACDSGDYECEKKAVMKCDSLYGDVCGKGVNDWTYGLTEYMSDRNKDSYQGVCPEGWRIPTVNDWNSLLQMIGGQYGVESKKIALALFGEDATGFGIEKDVDELRVDVEDQRISVSSSWWTQFLVADARVRNVTLYKERGGLTPDKVWFSDVEELWYHSIGYTFYAAPVRCIKE